MRDLPSPTLALLCCSVLAGCGEPEMISTSTGLSAGVMSATAVTAATTSEGGDEAESETSSESATTGSVTATESESGATESTGEETAGTTWPETCGDGVLNVDEECDDGNQIPGDGCEPDCTHSEPPPGCGDGELGPEEACDGDLVPLLTCAELDPSYTDGSLSCTWDCKYNTSDCEICGAPGKVLPCDAESDNILHAIGLGCDSLGGIYAHPFHHIPVSNFKLLSPDTRAYRTPRQFGTYLVAGKALWRAREGEKFLLITTGILAEPDAQGAITAPPGSAKFGESINDNPDGLTELPGIMSHQKGSNHGAGLTPFVNCDFVHDCSDSLHHQFSTGNSIANDVLYFEFDITVPEGTEGYSFDVAFFSAEYPEYIWSSYNDMAIVWSTSETYTGNVAFLLGKDDYPRPLTVTALTNTLQIKLKPQAPQLAGTGFDGEGGGTGWRTVRGSAAPGETFTLAWTIFDKSDSVIDTALIIDNFRWDCVGCIPSEINSCGLIPL